MREMMGLGARRLGVLGGVAALVVTAGVASTASAAGDDGYAFTILDHVIAPGDEQGASLRPDYVQGTPDGTLVYAFSRKALTDQSWSGGGLPAGTKVLLDSQCAALPGAKGVYTCQTGEDTGYVGPRVTTARSAGNVTVHVGVAYAPAGSDVAQAVKRAQLAKSAPVKGRVEAHSVRVLTEERARLNTLKLSMPRVVAGRTTTHSLKLHAVDKGRLRLGFGPSQGFRQWDRGELKVSVTSVTGGGRPAACTFTRGELRSLWEGGGITCEVKPGDVTIKYALKAEAKAPAWKIDTYATYEVYTSGWNNPDTNGTFTVKSPVAVKERHQLLARDRAGQLVSFEGTGRAARPFGGGQLLAEGWGRYTAVTKLAPVTVQGTGGSVVGRDRAGALWYYDTDGESGLWGRKKVSTGWNAYDVLEGVGDVTGDRKPDLLARDSAGVLWLFPGTDRTSAPFFGRRVKIGTGWKKYDRFVGAGDLTGDGRADLLARDSAGALWLRKGTGRAAAPFGPKVKVAGSWKKYDRFVGAGDLTGDGRADLLARDSAGALWLRKGTGRAAAPFGPKVKVAGSWKKYDLLF
ncbi:FG-GAP repeat domain-containing protein [Streptomyces sp. NPDC006879]|uniref:FG-GAP repeat domain-containing protein n=1 Tax=Streptomyces sp. NPDC006879 TaxID=3364767 RepID=UPI0036BAEB0E